MIEPERPAAEAVKHCCASLYAGDTARFLFGESYHPGGIALTLELAAHLQLDADSLVLDVASGAGTSAFALAEHAGCRVVGIDLSAENVAAANAEAARRELASRVRFERGDAEHLPFDAASFDALLCECAFCTFPDKPAAAAEFARVMRPGGRIGMSDLTRRDGAAPGLDGLLAWAACLGDAQPLERYAGLFADAGFRIVVAVERDRALQDLVERVRARLALADVLIALEKLALPGFDLPGAKRLARAAASAVADGTFGYALLVAEHPAD